MRLIAQSYDLAVPLELAFQQHGVLYVCYKKGHPKGCVETGKGILLAAVVVHLMLTPSAIFVKP